MEVIKDIKIQINQTIRPVSNNGTNPEYWILNVGLVVPGNSRHDCNDRPLFARERCAKEADKVQPRQLWPRVNRPRTKSNEFTQGEVMNHILREYGAANAHGHSSGMTMFDFSHYWGIFSQIRYRQALGQIGKPIGNDFLGSPVITGIEIKYEFENNRWSETYSLDTLGDTISPPQYRRLP